MLSLSSSLLSALLSSLLLSLSSSSLLSLNACKTRSSVSSESLESRAKVMAKCLFTSSNFLSCNESVQDCDVPNIYMYLRSVQSLFQEHTLPIKVFVFHLSPLCSLSLSRFLPFLLLHLRVGGSIKISGAQLDHRPHIMKKQSIQRSCAHKN